MTHDGKCCTDKRGGNKAAESEVPAEAQVVLVTQDDMMQPCTQHSLATHQKIVQHNNACGGITVCRDHPQQVRRATGMQLRWLIRMICLAACGVKREAEPGAKAPSSIARVTNAGVPATDCNCTSAAIDISSSNHLNDGLKASCWPAQPRPACRDV